MFEKENLELWFKIPDQPYSKAREYLNDEQIAILLNKRLEAYAAMQHRLPGKQVFDDFLDYMKSSREKIGKYPLEIVNTLLDILGELAPTEKWVSIWDITDRLNQKLFSSEDQQNRRITGVKVGNLLRLLGFNERKRIRLATHCLVRHDILRLYRKEVV